MKNYNLDNYLQDIETLGLKETWDKILLFCSAEKTEFLNVDNFGELYEIGLAHVNKQSKKELGKYFTPKDVATLMSEWLIPLEGENVCDVCCGTGNLIVTYLNLLSREKVADLLQNEKIHIYDIDPISLKICKYSIAITYGMEYLDKVQVHCGDFLKENLPDNSKVISNPPYFKMTDISDDSSEVAKNTKEFYSAIMDRILKQSISSVIITPYSFISGNKFYSLRQEMNKHEGFIVSFDNVPGSIFNGRKYGIFNTNTSNSVRAAITVSFQGNKGYRCSPLIRFKNNEREAVLKKEVLEEQLSNFQNITDDNKEFAKINKTKEELFKKWKQNKELSTIVKNGNYKLYMPNSCRYFTVASKKNLCRTGKYELSFETEEDMLYAYCLINSSFCYWWWRIYDGGITYPIGLLKRMPLIEVNNKDELLLLAQEMISNENKYLTYKTNAGKQQENIKFPKDYREKINKLFLDSFGYENDFLDEIHNNQFKDL